MKFNFGLLIAVCLMSLALTADVLPEIDLSNNNDDWVPVRKGVDQLEEWKQTNIQCVLEFVTSLHSLKTDQPIRYVLGIDVKMEDKKRRRSLQTKKEESDPDLPPPKKSMTKTGRKKSRRAIRSRRRNRPFYNVKLEKRQLSDEMVAQMLSQINGIPPVPPQPPVTFDLSQLQQSVAQPGQPSMVQPVQQGVIQIVQPGAGQPIQAGQGVANAGSGKAGTSAPTVEYAKKTTKEKVSGAINAIHEWREQLITLAMNYASALRNLKLEHFVSPSTK